MNKLLTTVAVSSLAFSIGCQQEIDLDWFADSDGDGFGNPDVVVTQPAKPEGYVSDNTDCDDGDPNNYPGNEEVGDGFDNNCDDIIDDGFVLYYADADNDDFGDPDGDTQFTNLGQPEGYVTDSTDCDDTDPANYPGNIEIADGQDNNCDEVIDEGFVTYYADVDEDGYGDSADSQTVDTGQPAGYIEDGTDCDDTDASINPDGIDVVDGVNNDCSGVADDDTAYFGEAVLCDAGTFWGGTFVDGEPCAHPLTPLASALFDFDTGTRVANTDPSADLAKGNPGTPWSVRNGAIQVVGGSHANFDSIVCGPDDGLSYNTAGVIWGDAATKTVCLKTVSGTYGKYRGNAGDTGAWRIGWAITAVPTAP